MRKVWDIPGGVHPPESKVQSNQTPIAHIRLPDQIILPLSQHIGAPATPIVAVGDNVRKGQMVAHAQGMMSAAVHASTSGTVTAIEALPVAHPSGLNGMCIVIETDHQDTPIETHENPDYLTLSANELTMQLREAGIAGMGGAGFPAALKLSPRSSQPIDTLIINGTECEPYITADDRLMREYAEEIVLGTQLFAHILGNPDTVLIGIEDNKPEAFQAIRTACEGVNIEPVLFPTKYPSGGEKQLIQILTGKEVPSKKLPSDIGIVLQNVGTARAAYRAVRFGEPLIERVTTVVGQALDIQQNVWARIGSPINHILEQHGFQAQKSPRLIVGGPMMGFAIEQVDVPVVKTTNCVIAPSYDEMPEPDPAQPCIRCGMCAEACPASLLPQQLFWFSQAEEFEKLEAHNLFDCIECGACSYVCPSHIPLVQYYRHSKSTMRQLEADKQKSDKARQRFEFRQLRIEKAELEKEAKRLARKKAAEQAKAKKASAPAKAPDAPAKPTASPEQEQAKLERALAGAQNRLSGVQSKLADAQKADEIDQSRVDTLLAKIKQCELKVTETNSKLAVFKQTQDNLAKGAEIAKEKIAQSPQDQQKKKIASIEKRLTVAKEKLSQAEAEGSPSAAALRTGVEKLEGKLKDAQAEPVATATATGDQKPAMSAADIAIEKAKQKAAAQASMSDEEKQQEQVKSLNARIEKAQQRLEKAIEENNDNVDAFQAGLDKLKAKLASITTTDG